MSKALKFFEKINLKLQSLVPYRTAHSDTAALFYFIWVGFLVSYLINLLIAMPPSSGLGLAIVLVVWLLLVPADIFLPGPDTPLWWRLLYLLFETGLMLTLGVFDSYRITSYMLFSIIGQSAFILSFSGSLFYTVFMGFCFFLSADFLYNSGVHEVHMGLSWLIGASFTMLAMAFLRNTRDQQIKIAILNRQLEETNKLVRSQAERLAQQAREDSLTGLYNRRYMEYDLPREFERARRFSKPLSLAVIDVDYFKQVNDRFSHQVGDQVLVELAEIFRQHTRTSIDSVVRYGGEEFIIYFPETSLEVAAGNICERIRHLVEKHNWEKFSPGLSVTLSIGVAEASYLSDYKELINEADTRLYEAKQSGRNKVCFIEATPVKE